MKIEKSILEGYTKIDSELIWRMIEDGLFEVGDLYSFFDMVFKLRTRGALFINDFIEVADTTAMAKAAALRIVVVYKSKNNPEINFVKLGYNGIALYSKFGLKEERVLDLKPSDMAFSGLETVLGMNRYLVKNKLHHYKFISSTGPVITHNTNGEETAYAYPEFIERFKEVGLYQGMIVPIYEESYTIPWDVCCASCDSVAELRLAINKAVDCKERIL